MSLDRPISDPEIIKVSDHHIRPENLDKDAISIIKKLNEAKKKTNKKLPICLLVKTEMGNGVDFMMNTHEWHGVAPNDKQLEIALSQNQETLGDY